MSHSRYNGAMSDASDLVQLTAEALGRARAAWPDLGLADEDFLPYLARRVHADADPGAALRALHASDLFLACACLHRVPGALLHLERRHLDHLPAFLASLRRAPAFIDEVGQMLREMLLVGRNGQEPKLAEYAGRGSLHQWIRVAATRLALRLRQQPDERPRQDLELAERALPHADPEIGYIKERYREEFQRALHDAIAALSAEQRNLLRLNFVDGLNIEKIGALFHVHRATVARRIAAARHEVLERTRRLLRERLALGPTEFDSLAALVQSQLDLSLSAALRGEPG